MIFACSALLTAPVGRIVCWEALPMVGMCAICTMDLSRGVLFRMGMLVFQMGPMMRKVRGNKWV
jgi:hypothetical protein